MEVNKNGLTKEQIEKAMACETVEELMALAKPKAWSWRKKNKGMSDSQIAELLSMDADQISKLLAELN